jgi:hypothetical protein
MLFNFGEKGFYIDRKVLFNFVLWNFPFPLNLHLKRLGNFWQEFCKTKAKCSSGRRRTEEAAEGCLDCLVIVYEKFMSKTWLVAKAQGGLSLEEQSHFQDCSDKVYFGSSTKQFLRMRGC